MHSVLLSDIFPLLADLGLSFYLVYFLFSCAFFFLLSIFCMVFFFSCCRKDLLCVVWLCFLPSKKDFGGCGGGESILSVSVLNFSAKLGLGAVGDDGFFFLHPTHVPDLRRSTQEW